MAATASLKKSPYMIDGWLRLLLLEKINDVSLLLSLNEVTHYFKNGLLEVVFYFKKIHFLYKNVMFQIVPLKSSCSQRKQYPEGTFKVKSTPKELLFGESGCCESHNCKCNCLQLFF